MKVIGLTGGIASGKSTVSNQIQEEGFPVVDCDKIAHAVAQKVAPGFLCQYLCKSIDLVVSSLSIFKFKIQI